MNAEPQKGWWYRASREQKLAQIDAGIELGMTANQVAMNCGCYDDQAFNGSTAPSTTLRSFALYHGRQFERENDTKTRKCAVNSGMTFVNGKVVSRPKKRLHDAKEAYLAGEPVDMWAVQ